LESGDLKMSHRPETPFDNIESSHEYVKLLAEAIEVSLAEVEADLALAGADGADRRSQALQLVVFKMNKLQGHMNSSRRILNDLRTLRRLLLEERSPAKVYRQAAG
jgi:hypothetical protein